MSQTAMVWGASGGIGRAIVRKLAQEGWTTFAIARHAAELEGDASHVIEADVSDPRRVEAAVYAAALETDAVDLFVYAAGDITSAPVAELTPEAWDRILSANLSGAFLTTHYSLSLLTPDAHLVYIGAISERLRLPGLSAYAAAKAGLEAFVQTLGKEERKRRVTIVRPAAVVTPLWDKVPLRLPAGASPPEKVADAVYQAYAEGHKGILDLTA